MKKKTKRLTLISLFLTAGLVVPFFASPIFNAQIKKNDFKSLATANFPLTIYGWKSYLKESKTKSTTYFQQIQNQTLEMSHKPDLEVGETVDDVINKLKTNIAESQEIQYFFLYKIREFVSNATMLNLTGHKDQYSLETADLENLLAFKYLHQTPSNWAFIIWDHINDVGLPLTNIAMNKDLRSLVYRTFSIVQQTQQVDLDVLMPRMLGDQGVYGYSVWPQVKKYHQETNQEKQAVILTELEKELLHVKQTYELLEEDFNKDLGLIFTNWKKDPLKTNQQLIDLVNQNKTYQMLHITKLKLANIWQTLAMINPEFVNPINTELVIYFNNFIKTGLMFPLFQTLVNPNNPKEEVEFIIDGETPSFVISSFNQLKNSLLGREFRSAYQMEGLENLWKNSPF